MPTTWRELAAPVLRDGLGVVRRDDRHLQVGLDDPDRLVLADRPGLLQTLLHLERRPPAPLLDLVDGLVRDGWVVDAASRAATAAGTPAAVSLAVDVDPRLSGPLQRTLTAAGLRVEASAPVCLAVTAGEPRRGTSDLLMRDDVEHLWLALLPTAVRVGPFVTPGRSACLRCVDAHLGDLDPRRATVLHQLEESTARCPAADPCLVQIGLGFAVHDVLRRLRGDVPALRSATLTVDRDLEPVRRRWLRHPHCGCAWG